MEMLCEEVRDEHLDDPKALPQKLVALLDAGFHEEEQCIFLSRLKKDAPVERVDFADCTAYECFVNQIHIEDYLENGGLPPLEMLGRGIALAREIRDRLAHLHGTKHFRIIVAFDGTSCRVRFHTVRLDEEWLEKSASCRDEAIAVLETQEMEP
jgi:hypothetical protein